MQKDSPYEVISFIIINNQPDTKQMRVTKWAGTKYKKVFKYYQEKDRKESNIPEDKAYELLMPYIYIQGCDENETNKTLEKLQIQVNLGIDGEDVDNDTNNNNKERKDCFTNTHYKKCRSA